MQKFLTHCAKLSTFIFFADAKALEAVSPKQRSLVEVPSNFDALGVSHSFLWGVLLFSLVFSSIFDGFFVVP